MLSVANRACQLEARVDVDCKFHASCILDTEIMQLLCFGPVVLSHLDESDLRTSAGREGSTRAHEQTEITNPPPPSSTSHRFHNTSDGYI